MIRRPGGTPKWPIHGTVEPPFRRDTRDQGNCPLNRGVPSTEVTDTNIIQWILQSGDNQDRCPLNTGVHSIEVTDKRLYELALGGAGGTMCDLNDGVP